MTRYVLAAFCFLHSISASGQSHHFNGKVTDTRLQPLAFVSLQIKGSRQGIITKEDGSFSMELYPGQYDIVVSMIGYKSQVLSVVIRNTDVQRSIILEYDESSMDAVTVSGRVRDRAAEIVRNVIRHKQELLDAPGDYSCDMYIKATQEDSLVGRKAKPDSTHGLGRMAMAEIVLHLDKAGSNQYKEKREGVTIRGDGASLFYLSATEGDFNFYNNLIQSRSLSDVPFLSPVSYSGLLAYRFKTEKTDTVNGHKVYTISVRPRSLSNATVEGEMQISDSGWVLLKTRFSFPKYHLPEYDYFEVAQDYERVGDSTWMISRQQFIYKAGNRKMSISGRTIVYYRHFELQKTFPRHYFGVELSATSDSAYKQDSLFWTRSRSEPLTTKELQFIRYKDSIYEATHTEAYLDSMDRVVNKVTWKKLLLFGQAIQDHHKERLWALPPVAALYQPFQFGGGRLMVNALYRKTFPSRKNLSVYTNISYGFRNHDINGGINLSRMYNPFNRGFYTLHLDRNFDYIFRGDAWINMIKRSNIYLNNGMGIGHGLELLNGLFLYSNLDFSLRRSVSGYDTNPLVDSLFGDVLDNNQAVDFEPYNALYGKLQLEYTPRQKYIREPREKIILGSKWPTFYVQWRKGIAGPLKSKVNFDYLEFGIKQEIKLGLLGISNYTVKTGSFPNTRDLRLVDYKYQRRGDPFLFLNPNDAFQSLDSSFAVFHWFYEGHYVHDFNGALINKIPLLKSLRLREVAGAGFLIAPERHLRYVEGFAGIERVFEWPWNPLYKFKLGVYVTGSAANQFRNPVLFKIGVTTWDRIRNRWF